MRRVSLLAVAALAVALTAGADVPQMINYQGRLSDAGGQPLDTLVDMVFSLYRDSSDVVPMYVDTQSAISVDNGLFGVTIGRYGPLIPDSVFNSADLWLGIKVGGDPDEINPRTRIVSVGYAYRVSSVDGARGGIISGDVSVQSDLSVSGKATIGPGHVNSGANSFIAGDNNQALGECATVSGGSENVAVSHSTVGGGWRCVAAGEYATVGGGRDNAASETRATVAGGDDNSAAARATVGGGSDNTASGEYSTVGGGFSNTAAGDKATVSGGNENTAGYEAVVGGGDLNNAGGGASVIGGGEYNNASEDYATIGGGISNEASGVKSTVGGGSDNETLAEFAVVGGGHKNVSSGYSSYTGGGLSNLARGAFSVVCGGGDTLSDSSNAAIGRGAFVGGGFENLADGDWSVVDGGYGNTANGDHASVPGGYRNSAAGNYSLAAGHQAIAGHGGAFVWADVTGGDFTSTAPNEFAIRAENGVRLATDAGSQKATSIGQIYRDNTIVAWGKGDALKSVTCSYGVAAAVRNSTGNYTITLHDSAINDNYIIVTATPHVDSPPTDAASARLLTVNPTGPTTFDIYITDGNYSPVDNEYTFIVTAR